MTVDVLTMLSDEDVLGSKSNSVGGCAEEGKRTVLSVPSPLRHMQSTNKKKRKQTTNTPKKIKGMEKVENIDEEVRKSV